MNTLVQLYGHKSGESAIKIYYVVLSEGVDPREYLRKLHDGILTGRYYTIEATAETSAEPMGIIRGIMLKRQNPEKYKALTAEIKEAIL